AVQYPAPGEPAPAAQRGELSGAPGPAGTVPAVLGAVHADAVLRPAAGNHGPGPAPGRALQFASAPAAAGGRAAPAVLRLRPVGDRAEPAARLLQYPGAALGVLGGCAPGAGPAPAAHPRSPAVRDGLQPGSAAVAGHGLPAPGAGLSRICGAAAGAGGGPAAAFRRTTGPDYARAAAALHSPAGVPGRHGFHPLSVALAGAGVRAASAWRGALQPAPGPAGDRPVAAAGGADQRAGRGALAQSAPQPALAPADAGRSLRDSGVRPLGGRQAPDPRGAARRGANRGNSRFLPRSAHQPAGQRPPGVVGPLHRRQA